MKMDMHIEPSSAVLLRKSILFQYVHSKERICSTFIAMEYKCTNAFKR